MPQETKNEFMARHGGLSELSDDERYYLFADGAMLANSLFPGCDTPHEPPDDPRARLPIVIAYHRARLQRIARQLRHLKAVLAGQHPVFQWDENVGQMPHGLDAPALADFLVGLAAEPKAKLQEAESALAALPQNATETERERRLRKALARRVLTQQAQMEKVLQTTL